MIGLRPSRQTIATGAVVMFVAAYIGCDIIAASGWNWRGWLEEIRGRILAQPETPEIRNYVEFISVEHDGVKVTTGIEYGSSLHRAVAKQWCYAERAGRAPGEAEYMLTLANKTANGPLIPNSFTDINLRPLGLSAASAQLLLDNQCRFKS